VDFDLRQWLLILGPVFIIGVLLHGYLRMHRSRNVIKMKLDKSYLSKSGEPGHVDELNLLKAELPNGGARVLSGADRPVGLAANQSSTPMHRKQQDVPVLMESAELEEAFDGINESSEHRYAPRDQEYAETSTKEARGDVPSPDSVPGTKANQTVTKETKKAPPARKPDAVERSSRTQASASAKPEKFVVMNVFALGNHFPGAALVDILIEYRLRFGEFDIFHRFDDDNGISFSLASAVEPGVFDMAALNNFSTPGVTLFMRVHEVAQPVRVFDEMHAVAEKIARDLDGEILDETRSVMTPQTLDHCRQLIKDFQYKYSA
jgi:cell division protein ZipA